VGGDWPSYGHDAANTRSQPDEHGITPTTVASLAPAWSVTLPGSVLGGLNTTPVVAGGCVVVGSSAGVLAAYDVRTGKQQWSVTINEAAAGAGGTLVGAPAIDPAGRVIVPVNRQDAPYAEAVDLHSGKVLWKSAPFITDVGSYTNASTAVHDGIAFIGFSEAEGDSHAYGGWGLLDTETGQVLKSAYAIPAADRAKGYAGAGIWSSAAFDDEGYAYVGAGNPSNKTVEHPYTNAILKVDVDPSRPTFGEVVAAHHGNVDQYTDTLQALSHTPACAATEQVTFPTDDPVCAQLDLDFGASPNLVTGANGQPVVVDLQKSGVVHAARTDGMTTAWSTLVGGSCLFCNAASTAYDGTHVFVVGTPGGVLWSLDATTGARQWATPIADGVHYQSVSVAAGVVYTVDGDGFLDAVDAATGSILLRRPMTVDAIAPTASLSSAGIAVADHTVFAATATTSGDGVLAAYRPAG
jgi:outer membrane protein assembly factor BamB